MTCPRCSGPMTQETLDGHLGRPVTIDLCMSCQAFWFDTRESLQLSPASTLRLFELIGDQATAARSAPASAGAAGCPRCRAPLRLTRDMQRSTRFEYLACPRGHGRLTTFFNFLREKNFIRPLSPQQIAELRRNVQSVNCSNCGAPVDLTKGTACAHCSSPLSMLDMAQAERLISELRGAASRPAAPIDPSLPLQLEHVRRSMHASFDTFERDPAWFHTVASAGLVGAGLSAIARWLKDRA